MGDGVWTATGRRSSLTQLTYYMSVEAETWVNLDAAFSHNLKPSVSYMEVYTLQHYSTISYSTLLSILCLVVESRDPVFRQFFDQRRAVL